MKSIVNIDRLLWGVRVEQFLYQVKQRK